MKRICITAIVLLGFIGTGTAQFSLSYRTHGLLPDQFNDMKICSYVDPGNGGFNIVWDFSELEATKNFEGKVDDISVAAHMADFPSADVVLKEFSNQFYFSGNTSSLELLGVAVNDRIIKKFDQPFVKMKYPFSYGDSYSGNYSGEYASVNPKGSIAGNYVVSGDGFGTLILPNGIEVEDVLRVKTKRTYTRTINDRATDVEITTYRWYTESERFPLLVLIESKANGKVVSNQAAFKDNIKMKKAATSVAGKAINPGISIYPNPYVERVNIEYAVNEGSDVSVDVYNSLGNKVENLVNQFQETGNYKVEFSAKELGLSSGVYYIKLDINKRITVKKIVEVQ